MRVKVYPVLFVLVLISKSWCQFDDGRLYDDNNNQLPRILILNPVNLATYSVLPVLSDQIRNIFKKSKMWDVIPFETIKSKYKEYEMDVNKPCKEFTCAYDAGSVMQAEYSLYSTVTRFQDLYIYNLNLIDIAATKVVWSEVGEVFIKSRGNSTEALIHRFEQLIFKLDPAKIVINKIPAKGLLGILDLSVPSDYSKILFERLATHAYTSGQYDLIGQTELNFLVDALKLDVTQINTTKEVMIPLGEKLGLDFLIYSKLNRVSENFKLKLALYDIQNQKLVREWPYEAEEYRKLLKFEDKFFSTLLKVEESPQTSQSTGGQPKSKAWKWVVSGASFVAAGILGYQAWVEHENVQDEYEKWKNSLSLENRSTHEQNVKDSEKKRLIYGILGGGLVLTAGVVLAF